MPVLRTAHVLRHENIPIRVGPRAAFRVVLFLMWVSTAPLKIGIGGNVSQQPEAEEMRSVGTPADTKSARPEAQRKKHFWPWMAAIAVGSAVPAIVIARWGYPGHSRVLVAAIWYVLVLIGYRFLRDRE